MPAAKSLPPIALINSLFRYEPETGHFYHLRGSRRMAVGARAGATDRLGYVWLLIGEYKQCAAHRIAWLLQFNEEPETVDHIDGNPNNNSISNLRAATRREQMRNRKVSTRNKSGLKGAYYMGDHGNKKWRARIKIEGRFLSLGVYATADEAHQVYRAAAIKHFGEFCPGDDRLAIGSA